MENTLKFISIVCGKRHDCAIMLGIDLRGETSWLAIIHPLFSLLKTEEVLLILCASSIKFHQCVESLLRGWKRRAVRRWYDGRARVTMKGRGAFLKLGWPCRQWLAIVIFTQPVVINIGRNLNSFGGGNLGPTPSFSATKTWLNCAQG
jgi:hypothetical protein